MNAWILSQVIEEIVALPHQILKHICCPEKNLHSDLTSDHNNTKTGSKTLSTYITHWILGGTSIELARLGVSICSTSVGHRPGSVVCTALALSKHPARICRRQLAPQQRAERRPSICPQPGGADFGTPSRGATCRKAPRVGGG